MPQLRSLPIIMCSMSRWDGELSSAAYSLAKEFAKSNKVFYIDYPYTIKDFWSGRKEDSISSRKNAILRGKEIYSKVPGLPDNFTAVTPPMMISINFLPNGLLYDRLSAINNKRFFRTVRQILKDHNIEQFIFFNSFNPFYGVELPEDIKPEFFVYQSRDDIRAIETGARHGVEGERVAIKNADVLLTTSTNLKMVIEKDGGRNVQILPNAAQTDLFRTALKANFELPEELKGNTRPVVGYIGHIGLRQDFELLASTIRAHPDKLFLMVGPGDYAPFTDEDFHSMENVVFTGPKPLEELPRYLHFMDCALIPFRKNDLTRSIYPLKMNEYLAAGKAIVSTDFSVDVSSFEDVAFIANSHEDFIQKVELAVQSNTEENIQKRVQRSEGNSWADRVELFWKVLEERAGA